MTHAEIVQKLIGPINPIGDSGADTKRFANLEATIELVDELLDSIQETSSFWERQEQSMGKAGKRARHYLFEIADTYKEEN